VDSFPVLAAACGFEAMRAYERHAAQNGPAPSHQVLKEILAGFAAAEVDKQFETRGLNWLDREKAKKMAINQAHYVRPTASSGKLAFLLTIISFLSSPLPYFTYAAG